MVIDATKSSVDTLMLLSADRDFIPSIERVKEFGKEVIIALPNYKIARDIIKILQDL